jgi:CRP-like cAMP-binding protein
VAISVAVDRNRFLAEVPLFSTIEAPVRNHLGLHAQLVERKRRQTVIRQGAPADAIYVVVRGYLKISVQSHAGSAASLTVLGPGELFGELGVLGSVTRSAELVALEDATLVRIPGPVFLDALSKSAALGLALSRVLGERLRSLGEHVSNVTALQAPARFAQQLLWLLDRFGKAQKQGVLLAPPLNQSDLAELSHLSRQRINLVLRDLRERRIVDWEGRQLLVRDLDGLRAMAQGQA